MFEFTLRVQPTPYGWRLAGPDTDRVCYLQNGQVGAVQLANSGEPLWSSDDGLELWVTTIADGIEVKVKVRQPNTPLALATAKVG